MKENANISLPISINPLNFPSKSNYLQRNFELFNIKLISMDKFHFALDIMQNNFESLLEAVTSKPEAEAKLYNSIIVRTSFIDQEFIHIITAIIEILLQAQSEETENLLRQKITIQGNIATIKGNINSLNTLIEKNPEFHKINIEISEITKIILNALTEFKEEHLKTSYSILQKRKDELEIFIYSNLAMIILKKAEVSPTLIEKMMRSFRELHQQMTNFDPKEIEEFICYKISQNLENINHLRNQKIIGKKIVLDNEKTNHLKAIFKWIKGIVKLGILYHQKDRMLTNSNYQIVKELEKKLNDLVIQEKQINSNNEVENEIGTIRGIIDELSSIGELSKQIISHSNEYINAISDNQANKIESLFKEEKVMIAELYSPFLKVDNHCHDSMILKNGNSKQTL